MDINYHHGDYNISDRWSSVDYIVVHYTGSGSSDYPCALNNCQYFAGGDRSASAHYFIDDSGIYEYADPDEYATWHCGDGHGIYGITNANSVGIEVCSSGEDFTDEEIEYLRQLVGYLMDHFGIDADHVVRHYDASRKLCPAPYIDEDKWEWLHSVITSGERHEEDPIDIKEIDMTDWAIVAFDGTGYLYAGGKLHPLKSSEEQGFVEWICQTAKEQRDRGEMPHIGFAGDGEGMYQRGPWGRVLAEILAR